MSRLNAKKTVNRKVTVNKAGGHAYKASDKLTLVSTLLTNFVQNQYYKSAEDTMDELSDLIQGVPDKEFVAKAAIYARNVFGMRSITHVTAAELAYALRGQNIPWKSDFFQAVIHRVDDMAEILAYYMSKYGKPIPNAIKRGFRAAFNKFDEYQLSKYRGEGKEVSLVDIVNLVHPKGNAKNKKALAALIKGELKSTETWEAKLTQAGQKADGAEELADMKSAAWRDLVFEKKLGYMALLRNLRNMLKQADKETLEEAIEQLKDQVAIKKSLIMPFRFVTAYEELEKETKSRKVLEGISEALDLALANVPKLSGRTLVALDQSGSMGGKPAEIGSMFAAILTKSNDADLMTFDTSARYTNVTSKMDTMSLTQKIRQSFTGGGTNFEPIFDDANDKYDRIIILSDMQAWAGRDGGNVKPAFQRYIKRFGVKPHIYSFNLQDYGTLAFPEEQVYAIAGFNTEIFRIMGILEQDKKALVHEIDKVEFSKEAEGKRKKD